VEIVKKENHIEVKLSSGDLCLLDYDCAWILEKFRLYQCKGHVTASMSVHTEYGSTVFRTYVHRLVMGITKETGISVDHINRNGYDNRKQNLRFASHKQNQANKGKKLSSGTNFKGVSVRNNHKNKKFGAFFRYSKSANNLGYFSTEIEAAKLYDINAYSKHGEFAFLNIPENKSVYGRIIKKYNLDNAIALVQLRKGLSIKRSLEAYSGRQSDEVIASSVIDLIDQNL
jgi:hypothetical protein